MLINREKETNGKAVTYLDRLQENYHDLFSKPLQKSGFTQTDIKMIETELGYALPKPYIDFLQSYQLPKCFRVSVSFCGDYACCYETEQEDDLFVTGNGMVHCFRRWRQRIFVLCAGIRYAFRSNG